MKTENEAYKGVKRDKLIYELERYKKAVQTRDLIIEKMRDEMYGQYQVGQILAGYIAILAGTDEREINKETVITRESTIYTRVRTSADIPQKSCARPLPNM